MSRIVEMAADFINGNGLARYAGGKRRGHDVSCPYDRICGEGAKSGFDLVGGGVPGDGAFAEIGLVGHVAGQAALWPKTASSVTGWRVRTASEEFQKLGFCLSDGTPRYRNLSVVCSL